MSEATQFRSGQSGNPNGRPKGARSKITVAIEALIDAASMDIATKAIELAKAGDATMIRALLDRAVPPRRDRHIPFELPPMKTAADAVKAAAAIAHAVADGELTPSEAGELSDFVANYAKALEVSDLEARLQRLEAVNR